MGRPAKVDQEVAFEMYFGELGKRGDIAAIAKHFDCAPSTITKLISVHGWSRRAIERDHEIRSQVDRKLVKTHAQRVVENLKLLDALKAIFAKQLMPSQNGRVNPNQLRDVSVREFLDMIKTELLLVGSPTDIPGETSQARTLQEIELELAEMGDGELEHELMVMLERRSDGNGDEPSD
jgi:hypothetical protein